MRLHRCGALPVSYTHLDVYKRQHQYELMEMLREFHEQGKTLVCVLHDLNQAARYADHLIVMQGGNLVTTGAPVDVVTEHLVEQVFGLRSKIMPAPVTGTPAVFPLDPRTIR